MGVRVEESPVLAIPPRRYFVPRFFCRSVPRGLSYECGPISRHASLHLDWKVMRVLAGLPALPVRASLKASPERAACARYRWVFLKHHRRQTCRPQSSEALCREARVQYAFVGPISHQNGYELLSLLFAGAGGTRSTSRTRQERHTAHQTISFDTTMGI